MKTIIAVFLGWLLAEAYANILKSLDAHFKTNYIYKYGVYISVALGLLILITR